jgi:hypothetical protein
MLAATRIRIDWVALVLGAGLAALAVTGWRLEGGTQAPAATVTVVTTPTRDLDVTPGGETSAKAGLRATGPEGGFRRLVKVRNATGEALDVRVTAKPEGRELVKSLSARVEANGKTVFEGPLAQLKSGSQAFHLASHDSTQVSVLLWIDSSANDAWRARADTIRIGFDTTPTT